MKTRLIGTLAALAVLVLVGAGGSSSRVLAQAAKGQTGTTVTASVKQPVFGQNVTFTATVTRLSGSGKFSGKVEFYSGVTKIGVGTLQLPNQNISGSNTWTGPVTFAFTHAIYQDPPIDPGRHTISAVYSGNSSFAGSKSLPLPLTVGKAATTTVESGAALELQGSVRLTAKVTAKAPSHAIPTGTVTFLADRKKVGSRTLRRGKATFTLTFQGSFAGLAVGKHSTTAVYGGSPAFTGSTSRPQALKVGKVATKTKLALSPNPSVFGQAVTFTATVTSGAGVPKGTVQFKDGGVTVATVTVNSDGLFDLNTNSLAVGPHSITATYSGDANSRASTSKPVTFTVGQAATTTTAVSSVKESPGGLTVAITVTVAPTPPGGGTFPTGTVTLVINGILSDPVTLSEGKVVLTTKLVRPGQMVTVTYSGDANFKGSSSTVTVGG